MKKIENITERFLLLIKGEDKAGEFYRRNFGSMFAYIQNRVPEICDEIYKVDDALKAGYGWQFGPFEIWNSIGLEEGVNLLKSLGHKPSEWIIDMLQNNIDSFYSIENNKTTFYDLKSKKFKIKPGQESFIILKNLHQNKTIWENKDSIITDLGDGIINV